MLPQAIYPLFLVVINYNWQLQDTLLAVYDLLNKPDIQTRPRMTKSVAPSQELWPIFWLRLNHVDYPLLLVNDVSPTHIDITVPIRLNRNTTTKLIYRDENSLLNTRIKVVSCVKDETHNAWRMRLAFYQEYTEQNTLCFLALRKYLSGFDGLNTQHVE